jgi:hypothetical protein
MESWLSEKVSPVVARRALVGIAIVHGVGGGFMLASFGYGIASGAGPLLVIAAAIGAVILAGFSAGAAAAYYVSVLNT